MGTENQSGKGPAARSRKRKAEQPTTTRAPRLVSVVGKLEGEDAIRANALARLPKQALLGYYAHLHVQGLFTGKLATAPPQEEWDASWDPTSVATLCASVELNSPTAEEIKQGAYDPLPAAHSAPVPLVLEVGRTTPRTPPSLTSAPARPPVKGVASGSVPDATVASLEARLEQAHQREAVLASRLDVLEAGNNNNKGPPSRSLALTFADASPSVSPEESKRAEVLPPNLKQVFLSLPKQVRTALFAGSHIPLARFRPQSFVQSLASGTKAQLEAQPDGTYVPVASGKHSPLTEHEFDSVLILYHSLDLFLRPARAIANAKDKLLADKVRKVTPFEEFYDWFELSSMAANATKPYAGIAPPDQDQWSLWYADLAARVAVRSSGTPSAKPVTPSATSSPRPSNAAKGPSKGAPLPSDVLRKASDEGFCIKFQRAYCGHAAAHVEMVGPDGKKVSTTLKHLCYHCGSGTHGWNACSSKPA